MSDNKEKSGTHKRSEHANSMEEYTMKDILESNVYARRIDRQKGLAVRPLEVWNIVDSNVSRDQVIHNHVKMPTTSKVTKKEDKTTVGEKISTTENKLKFDKESVEKEVASSNINEESETNVERDLTGDMIVNVGKNSITDGETMTIQELWDLGWIM